MKEAESKRQYVAWVKMRPKILQQAKNLLEYARKRYADPDFDELEQVIQKLETALDNSGYSHAEIGSSIQEIDRMLRENEIFRRRKHGHMKK